MALPQIMREKETIATKNKDNEHNEKQVTSEIPLDGFGALCVRERKQHNQGDIDSGG
jgi:hypothetical protein